VALADLLIAADQAIVDGDLGLARRLLAEALSRCSGESGGGPQAGAEAVSPGPGFK
jgi:hypothetical protein